MKQYLKIILAPLIAVLLMALLVISVQAQLSTSVHAQGITTSSPNAHITVTVSLVQGNGVTPTLVFTNLPTLPARLKLIDSAFTLQAQNNADARSMTIKVHYPPVDFDEKQLTIVYYDPNVEKWLPMSTGIDAANHIATANAEQSGIYALIFAPAAAPLPSSAIIVDDQDGVSRFGRFGNSAGWHGISGSTDHYSLGHMWWTSNTYSVLDNYGIWTPTLSSGQYQVYAFIDWNYATTQKARYQVVHNGQTTVYTVNQNNYYAEWVSLGIYNFGNVPSSNYVRLDDVTGETYLSKQIGFDAIGFVPNNVYLPIMLNNYPPFKSKSGIHLGNRSADWPSSILQKIDGDNGGVWPVGVVVLSDQVYNLGRPSSPSQNNPTCQIVNVGLFKPTVYDYMKRAAQAGVKVIIRVNPSPGNFQDWNDSTKSNHHLITTGSPAGGNYCNNNGNQQYYRDINDIAQEISQIHNYNGNDNWHEYAFEPANEPNLEWYPDTPTITPTIRNPIAWQEMNTYFVNLYNQAKSMSDGINIRLLTAPMAQSRYAEGWDIQTCAPRLLDDSSIGYDNMRTAYETTNDGVSWHNYWAQGREDINFQCLPMGSGEHVVSAFPSWLYNVAVNGANPSFITEADLFSPWQVADNPVTNKDANVSITFNSIQSFFQAEPANIYPVAWILNDDFVDAPGESKHAEIRWHQAYTPTMGLIERPWFTTWWGNGQ